MPVVLPLYRVMEIADERFLLVRSMDTVPNKDAATVYADRELQLCAVWLARYAYERSRAVPKTEARARARVHAEEFALRAGIIVPSGV